MTPADVYRIKAAEFLARAMRETRCTLRRQYESLGRAYLRLAEQADQNQRLDIVYETPAPNRMTRRN